MFRNKPFFIVFEGIEGSGKSYLSYKLYKNLRKKGYKTIITREPGGDKNSERIRKLILEDYFHQKNKDQFNKYTDTLLYLAARNEHVDKRIFPALKKKNIVICDRFVDSTIAYQVYGKGVKVSLINSIHKIILKKIKPHITFVLKVNINKSISRLKKREKKNRYDKFPKSFYIKAQKAFLKIAAKNKKNYLVLDNSSDDKNIEKIILNKVLSKLKSK